MTSWEEVKRGREQSPKRKRGYEHERRLHHAGDTVRALRMERGISQRELSRQAGVSVWTLSRLESGEAMPAVAALERISEALGARLEMATVKG